MNYICPPLRSYHPPHLLSHFPPLLRGVKPPTRFRSVGVKNVWNYNSTSPYASCVTEQNVIQRLAVQSNECRSQCYRTRNGNLNRHVTDGLIKFKLGPVSFICDLFDDATFGSDTTQRRIIIWEWIRNWKCMTVAYFKVLSQYLACKEQTKTKW